MFNTVLTIFMIFAGLTMFVSGIWLLIETFLFFRLHITRSLNSSLERIRIVKPRTKGEEGGDGGQAKEKEEIMKMEHFLASISSLPQVGGFFQRFLYGEVQMTFEIAVSSDSDLITFYVVAPQKFSELIERQIHSFFPSAHIEKVKDYTIFRPGSFTVGSYLGLKKKDTFPIRTYQHLESDPLGNITNALSKLESAEEGAAIQLVFRRSSSSKRGERSSKVAQKMQQGYDLNKAISASELSIGEGMKSVGKEVFKAMTSSSIDDKNNPAAKGNEDTPRTLTPEDQEVIKQLEVKANKASFDVNIRLLASAKTKERAEVILSILENSFVQFEDSNLNKFVTKRDKSRNAHELAYDFSFRNFRPGKAIGLDAEELASVFHFPISTTQTPKINWLKSKSAPPPSKIPAEGLVLGFSDFRGSKTEIRLSPKDRARHLYIIGQTGTGKSNFIKNLAKQDVKKEGMCIIDPHGDTIDDVMEHVPESRKDDIIFFDPSDTDYPMGMNMLEYNPAKPEEKTFVINEMIAIFDKLYDLKSTGGPMFEQYMRNAMLLVMASPETGSTIMEIPRIFQDVDFRKDKLKRCKDMTVVDFWEKEAEKAGGDAALENVAPYINSKLVMFVSNDMMRPIIAQQKSAINFRKLMDEGKILMVYLPKGKLGEINSHFLGMVVIGKLLMAALGRVDMPEAERRPFHLYVDEFQNFTTNAISQILSEARKYALTLTVAHQFIGQLSEEISKSVFGNVGSMCSFRVGSEDAQFLEKQFAPTFTADDLINVDNFQCFTKVLINNESSAPFDMKVYPPSEGNPEIKKALKEHSRQKYCRKRDEVEQEIRDRYLGKLIENEELKTKSAEDDLQRNEPKKLGDIFGRNSEDKEKEPISVFGRDKKDDNNDIKEEEQKNEDSYADRPFGFALKKKSEERRKKQEGKELDYQKEEGRKDGIKKEEEEKREEQKRKDDNGMLGKKDEMLSKKSESKKSDLEFTDEEVDEFLEEL